MRHGAQSTASRRGRQADPGGPDRPDDQKAARCQRSDTLGQCKDKLHKHCLNVKEAAHKKHSMDVGHKQLPVAEKLSVDAQLYAAKIKHALEFYDP